MKGASHLPECQAYEDPKGCICAIVKKKTAMRDLIIDPSLDEREKLWNEYYFINLYCFNCGKEYDGMVKKGNLKPKEYLECPYCGCISLK